MVATQESSKRPRRFSYGHILINKLIIMFLFIEKRKYNKWVDHNLELVPQSTKIWFTCIVWWNSSPKLCYCALQMTYGPHFPHIFGPILFVVKVLSIKTGQPMSFLSFLFPSFFFFKKKFWSILVVVFNRQTRLLFIIWWVDIYVNECFRKFNSKIDICSSIATYKYLKTLIPFFLLDLFLKLREMRDFV